MKLVVGDRADAEADGRRLPVEETVCAAVQPVLGPGSPELRRIFREPRGDMLSSDTCGASGYAPLSHVKVFAVREDARVAVTVAMPMLCVATPSERAYFRRKDEVLAALARRFEGPPFEIAWRLNTLDRPGCGAEGSPARAGARRRPARIPSLTPARCTAC